MRLFVQKFILQVGNFVAQYHFYVIAYVTSSFLAQFVGVANVGYVFIVSSVFVTLLLYAAPQIFRSFGTRNVITVLAIVELATLLSLALITNWIAAVVLVTIQAAISYAIFIGIDLLIEASTQKESATGSTRTLYLIISNAAVLLGALSLSFVVVGDEYWRAFATSALVLIPFVAMSLWLFPRISFPTRTEAGASVTQQFRDNPSLRRITLAHFLLQIFFSWMAIYSPILLFSYEGFAWAQIGVILAIAMLPYIVFEYPLGVIADKWLGEKEILALGFVIIAISLILMASSGGASFWWWVGVMVLSRTGAAMVEAMTEVHFFRHVSERDASTITTFRALRPLGNIAGPLIASVALLYLSLPITFFVFAVVMLVGVPVAWSIIDSK